MKLESLLWFHSRGIPWFLKQKGIDQSVHFLTRCTLTSPFDIIHYMHESLMFVDYTSSKYPRCSMVLVNLPTKLGDYVRANVGKYSIHGAYGYIQLLHLQFISSCWREFRHAFDAFWKSKLTNGDGSIPPNFGGWTNDHRPGYMGFGPQPNGYSLSLLNIIMNFYNVRPPRYLSWFITPITMVYGCLWYL